RECPGTVAERRSSRSYPRSSGARQNLHTPVTFGPQNPSRSPTSLTREKDFHVHIDPVSPFRRRRRPVRTMLDMDDAGDTVPGIAEGLSAGLWTVGLPAPGSEVGRSWEDWMALIPDAGETRCRP